MKETSAREAGEESVERNACKDAILVFIPSSNMQSPVNCEVSGFHNDPI